MKNYPAEIEKVNKEIALLLASIEEGRDLVAVISSREMLVILQKTDSNGKPVHSNDASRNAALTVELACDKLYSDSRQEVRNSEMDLRIKQAELERLRLEWQLYLTMRQEQQVARRALTA